MCVFTTFINICPCICGVLASTVSPGMHSCGAHGCRVCERTLEECKDNMNFSTIVADIAILEGECAAIEIDLRDSFNAFCFTCRRITMSVPKGVSCTEQACYLRSQVHCFQQLCAYGLVVDDNPHDDMDES
jgi:hypothetical protein